jgi:hypothetical protein
LLCRMRRARRPQRAVHGSVTSRSALASGLGEAVDPPAVSKTATSTSRRPGSARRHSQRSSCAGSAGRVPRRSARLVANRPIPRGRLAQAADHWPYRPNHRASGSQKDATMTVARPRAISVEDHWLNPKSPPCGRFAVTITRSPHPVMRFPARLPRAPPVGPAPTDG